MEQKQTEVYPPPPPWFKLYRQDADGSAERPLPPLPPAVNTGEFQMFGRTESAETGVPPLAVKQLLNVRDNGTVAFKEELSALNRELLLQYLDLVDMLVCQPSMYARAVEAISTIVRNMHFLLNTLRCHQSRATLEFLLQAETSERKQAAADLRSLRSQVLTTLKEYGSKMQEAVSNAEPKDTPG